MNEKFLEGYNNEEHIYSKQLDPRCKPPLEAIRNEAELKKNLCQPMTIEDKIEREIEEYHSSTQTDWSQNDPTKPDYVKNRTHYDTRKSETVTLTFDGNLEGRDIIEVGSDALYLVKVSDEPINARDVIGGTFKYTVGGNVDETLTIVEDMIELDGDANFGIVDSICVVSEYFEMPNGRLISKGVWFTCKLVDGEVAVYVSMLEYTKTTGELKKLDAKYLPDGVGGGGYDAILSFSGRDGMLIKSGSQIVSGTYTEMRSKLLAKEHLNILINAAAPDGDDCIQHMVTTAIDAKTYVDFEDLIYIHFVVDGNMYRVAINSDDEIDTLSKASIATSFSVITD